MISIIIVLLFLAVVICGFSIAYLIYFKKHTRERFAFVAVSGFFALITTFIIQVYSSQGYISAFVNVFDSVFSMEMSSYQTDFKDHIITLILITYLMNWVLKMYKNWNGPISEIQYTKEKYHEQSNIFIEALAQLKDIFFKEKAIVLYTEKGKDKYFNVFSSHEEDKMPWYENVYELLTFANNQYKIDLIKDYYPDKKSFISKYGVDNQNIAIFCCIDFPNDSSIYEFIQFAKTHKIEFSKYIIAVKRSREEIRYIQKYGIEIIVRNENEMLDSLIDFSSYKQFINDQFISKEISINSKLTLNNMYVNLFGKDEEGNPLGEIEEYIYNWLEKSHENKHLAILGEYGCGKSVVSLKITNELLQRNSKENRIPILIELRGKSPRNLNATEILSTWATNYRLDAASLLKLHKAGKLLIIFEGFDEMDMIGDREMRLNHFQRLWEFATPKSKIIITGRPNFFLDDKELKTNLGIDKQYEGSHYCEAIYLKKFNIEQIRTALRSIDNNTKEQIVDILERSTNSNFLDLISRPSILYLVSVIWKERKLSDMKDDINSAIVISEFIKYSYSRQNNKNILFPLSEKEREYFMLGISVGMLRHTEFSNQINKNDLETIIIRLYKKFPDEVINNESAIGKMRKPLKERMIDNCHSEDTILTDVRSCGILVNDLTRKDYFKFAHKSFFEYQISLFFVEMLLQDKGNYNIMMNSISDALETNMSEFRHSNETITFISEILISKLELNKTRNQYDTCRKLFCILYPNKITGRYPKIASFSEMYIPTPFFFSFILMAPTMLLMNKYITGASLSSLSAILSVIMSMYIVFIFTTRISLRYTKKRMNIWLQCCRQLLIPEDIIKETVSKKYILFLEGEKVDPVFILLKILLRRTKINFK